MESLCKIGHFLNVECDKLVHTRKTGRLVLADLSAEEKTLLEMRSGLQQLDMTDGEICLHHFEYFVKKFSHYQRTCVDPGNIHKNPVHGSLRVIDIDMARTLSSVNKKIAPGMKLCPRCVTRAEAGEFTSVEDTAHSSEEDPELIPESSQIDSLGESITALGCSPLKMQKLSASRKTSYLTKKVQKAKVVLDTKLTSITGEVDDLPDKSMQTQCTACSDLSVLIEALKEKCSLTTARRDKVQILTLVPSSWTIDFTAQQFNVSKYLVKKSREIKNTKGILSKPEAKQGNKLSEDAKQAVMKFYQRDDISRICPGKKDYVSVRKDGQKVHEQKRLLLANMNELYASFKKETSIKIGFSKFCDLRPKFCVTVGSSGSHSVCVCTFHQNTKLQMAGLKKLHNMDYKMLMSKIVCDVNSRDCMLHKCAKCPGKDALKTFLEQLVGIDTDEAVDADEPVTFKQWVNTDRTTLVTQEEPLSDFIDNLCSKVNDLTCHDFIAKAQSNYLKNLKDNLVEGTCIILGDFAENYSFIIQDAAQGYHWDNTQCTLHPFAVYHKEGDTVACQSVCMISDHLKHDTITVHAFLKVLIPYLQGLMKVDKVIYFSDGAASQYKNFKNFANLCCHARDFGPSAEWHFFATSHGKSPCDGIGGTVKRLVARASLQSPVEGHIMYPRELYDWAVTNITGIKFFWVDKLDVAAVTKSQQERFEQYQRIPGTRDNHCFVPVSDSHLQVKRVSEDTTTFTVQACKAVRQGHAGESSAENLDEPNVNPGQSETTLEISPGQYVACLYDGHWWIANIISASSEPEYDDFEARFLHPHGPAKSFYWPREEDKCWVPRQHVLCTVPVPDTTGSGRRYKFSDANVLPMIEHKWKSKV